jgi:hypothetical protein
MSSLAAGHRPGAPDFGITLPRAAEPVRAPVSLASWAESTQDATRSRAYRLSRSTCGVLGELLWQLAKLSEGGMIITVFTLDGISVLVTETLGMHEMHLGGKHMAFSSRV